MKQSPSSFFPFYNEITNVRKKSPIYVVSQKSANILPRIGASFAEVAGWTDQVKVPITRRWFLYRQTRILSPYKFTCATVRVFNNEGVFYLAPRHPGGPKIPGTSSTINPACIAGALSLSLSLGGISSGVSATLVSTSKLAAELRERRERARDDIRCAHDAARMSARDTPLINRRYDH